MLHMMDVLLGHRLLSTGCRLCGRAAGRQRLRLSAYRAAHWRVFCSVEMCACAWCCLSSIDVAVDTHYQQANCEQEETVKCAPAERKQHQRWRHCLRSKEAEGARGLPSSQGADTRQRQAPRRKTYALCALTRQAAKPTLTCRPCCRACTAASPAHSLPATGEPCPCFERQLSLVSCLWHTCLTPCLQQVSPASHL